MATRFLRYDSDPILRKKCKAVLKVDDKIRQLLDDIIEMSEMMATATAKSTEEIKSFLSRQFDMFSIYEVLPQILELWGDNIATDVQAKKGLAEVSGK